MIAVHLHTVPKIFVQVVVVSPLRVITSSTSFCFLYCKTIKLDDKKKNKLNRRLDGTNGQATNLGYCLVDRSHYFLQESFIFSTIFCSYGFVNSLLHLLIQFRCHLNRLKKKLNYTYLELDTCK